MRNGTFLARTIAWLPVVALPTAVVVFSPENWPRWAFMWLLAVAIFMGCKWLTWQSAAVWNAPVLRHLGYLFAWPGLDAVAFLSSSPSPSAQGAPDRLRSWLFALGKLLFGVVLIASVFPHLSPSEELLRGWVGMVGIVFVLHFGLFHLLSLFWKALVV